MQIKKEEIRQAILAAAKVEFLEKGYEKASLRTIAKKAKVTKGSIYTYFKNKDTLFTTLTAPAMDFFYQHMSDSYCDQSLKRSSTGLSKTLNHAKEDTRLHCAAILEDYETFQLLFFHSAGSSVEKCRETIIQLYARQSHRYYALLGERRPEFTTNVSEMFLHTLGACYIAMIEELLLHSPTEEELNAFVEQLSAFVHFGIENMLLHQGLKQQTNEQNRNATQVEQESL